MPQDRQSGAAGREYGLMMARGLARLMQARRLSQGSNEVEWNGKRAVIKSCAPATDQIGVTITMLPRLDVILAAFEDDRGIVTVWELSAEKYRSAMFDSRSKAKAGLQMVRRRYAEQQGKAVAIFPTIEVRAAGVAV